MAEPKTRAEAVAAAEAVNEARLEVCAIVTEDIDRRLYHVEMKYWRLANGLSKPKPRKKR